ncbi:MAG TPA: 2-C-methyl-D-erythritol 4-phosphate cytidylyltransferase [Mucilaginibacter sp.]|jgi:2-C-methyl-D-erythritol 4-phosphate cytidylyltransferase|nr:2-C-methyl-D-erythritol 4-phosphate cytidylyltransferase [Mucilaginibacter sp.]
MTSTDLISHISNLTSQNNYVIIVAGGSGTRMGASIPKQFLLLKGRPILMHTIEAFYHSKTNPYIITVLPDEFHAYWEELCVEHEFNIQHLLVKGGHTRFHSVKNGLDTIGEEDALVAVHDAVRPLTKTSIIDLSYAHAAEHGNAVAAVKSRDTVRQFRAGASRHLLRDEIYLVQTPQTFRASQLKQAYGQSYSNKFTDDASVVESAGFTINLIEGSHHNIKITFPEDIALAEVLLGL